MKPLAPGARRLPTHHITIRVPWHDSGWAGSVCARPLENTSCLIPPRIGEGKRDEVETRCAGKRLDQIDAKYLPPCVGERVSFMAPFELQRMMRHPYAESSTETHGHFAPTPSSATGSLSTRCSRRRAPTRRAARCPGRGTTCTARPSGSLRRFILLPVSASDMLACRTIYL